MISEKTRMDTIVRKNYLEPVCKEDIKRQILNILNYKLLNPRENNKKIRIKIN